MMMMMMILMLNAIPVSNLTLMSQFSFHHPVEVGENRVVSLIMVLGGNERGNNNNDNDDDGGGKRS